MPSPSGDLPPGAIVGIVFGLLIVLVLGLSIVVVVLYLMRRRKSGGKHTTINDDIGLGKHLHASGCVLKLQKKFSYYEVSLQ